MKKLLATPTKEYLGTSKWSWPVQNFRQTLRPAYQDKRCSLLDYLEKKYRIKISRMSPNRIFMFLINPPSGNFKIQKLIAKHIFECFEKRKGEEAHPPGGLYHTKHFSNKYQLLPIKLLMMYWSASIVCLFVKLLTCSSVSTSKKFGFNYKVQFQVIPMFLLKKGLKFPRGSARLIHLKKRMQLIAIFKTASGIS